MAETEHSRVKQFKEFISLVPRLEADEFIATCKLMSVDLVDKKEKKVKDFDKLYEELLNNFIAAPQINRINMVLLLKTLLGDKL